MHFLKRKKQIKVDRDSVCMGDDCTAPNEKRFDVTENALLSDVFQQVAAYLPRMSNAVWAVDTGKKVIGYIIMDGDIHYELCREDQFFSELGIEALHCSYFHSCSFTYRNGAAGNPVEKYPECRTLLEKVKCCMEERFLDELRINGGSLWVWYEYGKEPVYENLYVRQYTKNADGKILREEGKRRDVKDGDGVLFQADGENAVRIV